MFAASATLGGQQPAPPAAGWVHFPVCASGELTLPDRQVLESLTRDLNRIVRDAGGRVETGTADRACVTPEELTTRLSQASAGRRTTVVVDGPTFRGLSTTSPGVLARNGIRPVNPRLFTRPLRVFVTADAAVLKNDDPRVGIYVDRDVPIASLEVAVAALTGKKTVRAVPFNTVAELARCFETGRIVTGSSGCPANLTWAAILEQDVSTTTDAFTAEYQRLSGGKLPTPLPKFEVAPGVHGTNPDRLVLVALTGDYPSLGSPSGSDSLAAVPRGDGTELERQLQQETRRDQSWGASLFAWVGVTAYAADDVLKHPFPVVLGSEGFPDTATRSALSDSYLRAVGTWQVTPCTAAAERLHRAFLFNAYLENPADKGAQLGLGSALSVARAGDLTAIYKQLQLSANPSEWRAAVGSLPRDARCIPANANERFPEARLFYANQNLASQYRAMEHLRRASGAEGATRQQALSNAAICLRKALETVAGPSCHASERSTYSFYYNPYFYYAVQQASGGRETK